MAAKTDTKSDTTNRTARYLVAKYIPDLRRMEPRNIGVIVWSPSGIVARFQGEKRETGEVDGRHVPGFVRSLTAYRQWIEFWREQVQVEASISGEETPARSASHWEESIKSASKGNYCVVDGGFLLDRITPAELPHLLDTLYSQVVETAEPQTAAATFDDQLNNLLKKARLDRNKNFKQRYPVKCQTDALTQDFIFSFAYANGSLQRLYERVALQPNHRQRNVDAAAWKFQSVLQSNVLPRDKTAALIYVPETKRGDAKLEGAIDVLSSVTRVINVADEDQTSREFNTLTRLTH